MSQKQPCEHFDFSMPGSDVNSISEIMSALFESVDDGIVVGDMNGRILFGNRAAIRINDNSGFPVNPEERLLRYVASGGEEFSMKISDLPLRRAVAEGEIKGLELTLITATGRKKNLICNGRALFNPKNEKVGAILVLHDQTSERSAERQNAQLEKERAKLLRMNEELERFAAVAAHDLKSPLNSITQFVELLRENLSDKISSDDAEMMDFISNAGARLRSLIDDLLAYARSGANLGEMTSVDLQTVVESVEKSLMSELKSAGARLEVGPMPIVTAHQGSLSQVFQNLIANAVKYRSERPPVVRIHSYEEGDHWRFEVEDNGVGIRNEDQPMAFELFKRFEVSSNREGTGLGLAICKRIVEAHGGTIWLKSTKGVGTTIVFTLPKAIKNQGVTSQSVH